MARFAVVENGIVTNVIEASAEFAEQIGAVSCSPEAAIGWQFSGGIFSAPSSPQQAVPEWVTMRQARLAMLGAGILDEVDIAIQHLSQAYRIEWEYATDLRRDHPLVGALGPSMGLSEGQIDDLFRAASAIR